MDSLITAAARALAAGDALGALKRVALRADPPALALRGIAMAQLGELARARTLLRRAARAFSAREAVARARCIVAEAEVALAARDLGWQPEALDSARATLAAHGDRVNAAHAHYLAVRRLLLTGRLAEAERRLALSARPHPHPDLASLPPPLRATHELLAAGIAIHHLQTQRAAAALTRAAHAARLAGIPALIAEVEGAWRALKTPAARLIVRGGERLLLLEDVEALLASDALIVDARRHVVRAGGTVVSLAGRPVLFALVRALAQAWPADVPRATLIRRIFRTKFADESHRARLRVELGRLRMQLAALAGVSATKQGFALLPCRAREVVVLARPVEEARAPAAHSAAAHAAEAPAAVLALLADGESWSSSALALALRTSQRTVQRALDSLAAAGRIQPVGRGRARRWMTPPLSVFTTTLLLPAPLPGG
jgi:hypothetical protein